jgi:hypothetical protein
MLERLRRAAVAALASAIVVFAVSSGSGLRAAPLVYNEAVHGDLTGAQTLAFDFGANRVTGTAFNLVDNDDFDPFAFTLPGGGALASVLFRFATQADPDTTNLTTTYRIREPGGPFLAQDPVDLLGPSPVDLFASALPLSGPQYEITHGFGVSGPGGSWNYTMIFTVVSAVPEPSTIALLAAGLLGIGAYGRRARKMAAC